jgi:hypothetical protein
VLVVTLDESRRDSVERPRTTEEGSNFISHAVSPV